ncbi:hypothetical protein OS493_023005 [Desmophyllum pertusum]|uniref:Uncharacterized protein n=1 Tax=Desmophyllum pertusum TaxID=174260 RepID=A0A9W9ZBK6_9CNID|nr:hypothetical protein OS493_023005 [Desmophyllum pertusum]
MPKDILNSEFVWKGLIMVCALVSFGRQIWKMLYNLRRRWPIQVDHEPPLAGTTGRGQTPKPSDTTESDPGAEENNVLTAL